MNIGSISSPLIATPAIPATPKSSPGAFDQVLNDSTSKDGASSRNDPVKLANAARQFEGLMVGQLLKSAHGSDSGGFMGAGDDDDSSSTAIQMAEEYLGQAIANGGGLGISKMIVKGFHAGDATDSNSAPTPASPLQMHKD